MRAPRIPKFGSTTPASSAKITSTASTSISEKPAAGGRAAGGPPAFRRFMPRRPGSLRCSVPVADVLVRAFAARLAVRAERPDVERLRVLLAGREVLVGRAPGVLRHRLRVEVAAGAVVARLRGA